MSWFGVLKDSPDERAIELIEDIIERNPEFELRGDTVIIKPSWLNPELSWGRNINLTMGVDSRFFLSLRKTRFDLFIDFFSFSLDDIREFPDRLLIYVHLYYKTKDGAKDSMRKKICLARPINQLPVGDYYASFLLASKDKNQFKSLWGF